jgi:hypothetical protein
MYEQDQSKKCHSKFILIILIRKVKTTKRNIDGLMMRINYKKKVIEG